jgi:hypothetical protein
VEEVTESSELYRFTGVRRHYVVALRTQLPVPEDGWTVVWHPPECEPPILTCEGVECPRAVVTRFIATEASDTRTVESLSDVFEAAHALAKSPKRVRPAFDPGLTFLRPVVIVAAPREEDETPEQHFDRCFGYVVDNARALLLASEELCPPVSRQQLAPSYIVVDEDADGNRHIEGAALMMDTYLGPSRATRHHTDLAEKFVLAGATKNPVEVHHDLRLAAQRAVFAEGDYIGGVLKAAAACETFIKQASWHLTWEATQHLLSDPAPTAMAVHRLFGARPSHLIGQVLSTRLGGDWGSRERGKPVGSWRHEVAQLRNRIIHLGHRPSERDAVGSVDALASLEKHVLDRLATRSNVYPRSSLMLVGKEGLERRGRFGPARATYRHQSLQDLLRDYRQWISDHDKAVLDD